MTRSTPAFADCLSRASRAWLLASIAFLASSAASAHTTGASYLHIDARAGSGSITATWDIAVKDLQWALDLDTNNDAKTSLEELQAQRAVITNLASRNLAIGRGGVACRMLARQLRLIARAAETFASLELEGQCSKPGALQVSTNLFFGSVAYTALLDIQTPAERFPAILSQAQPTWMEPAMPSLNTTLALFLSQGIWHVLIGYDHIAFLLLLLLPSVLRATHDGWHNSPSKRAVARDILKIVTAFTVAHSITLGLAASGTVRLPAQPIEIAIAGSIIVAGLMNLLPAAARWRVLLALGFGLVHGFGFANALAEIGAQGYGLAPMLAGFNLGVETAQLIIVAVALPVLFLLRRAPTYARRLMPALSLATAITGAFWLVARL